MSKSPIIKNITEEAPLPVRAPKRYPILYISRTVLQSHKYPKAISIKAHLATLPNKTIRRFLVCPKKEYRGVNAWVEGKSLKLISRSLFFSKRIKNMVLIFSNTEKK